ncbi:MAG: amino acid racemase [Defluviitaleaceae bacterium]|nr:amino acid racemase [Defluviitaleaceae bacterium]
MTLGIAGGMGVQATALFYEKLISLQKVGVEQDYIDVLIYSKSSIPDRTAFITGKSDQNPYPELIRAIETLRRANASCIAVPCVTSHYFLKDMMEDYCVPIFNMLKEMARYVSDAGYKKIGLLATVGTLHGRFFHTALAECGIETVEPKPTDQAALMEYIYAIKKGQPSDPAVLRGFADVLLSQGAEAAILGCTELSVAVKGYDNGYIDALDVLARAALKYIKG